jgi:hypothetical protein
MKRDGQFAGGVAKGTRQVARNGVRRTPVGVADIVAIVPCFKAGGVGL